MPINRAAGGDLTLSSAVRSGNSIRQLALKYLRFLFLANATRI
jgi:hypothetical protein